jgi:hypothetical protein
LTETGLLISAFREGMIGMIEERMLLMTAMLRNESLPVNVRHPAAGHLSRRLAKIIVASYHIDWTLNLERH